MEPEDRALLDAARAGLLSERAGVPLATWQQRVVDQAFLAAATGGHLYVSTPRMSDRRAIIDAIKRMRDA